MSMTEPNPSERLNHPVVPAVTTHLCYINTDAQLLVGGRFMCVSELELKWAGLHIIRCEINESDTSA